MEFLSGNLSEAERLYTAGLDIHEQTNNRWGKALALGNLGNVYHERDDAAKAEDHYAKALAIYAEIDNLFGQAQQYGNLGIVHAGRGDAKKAEGNYRQAKLIFEKIGAAPQVAQTQQLIEELRSSKE